MIFVAKTEAPPLRQDADGAVRIGETRVLLEMVLRAFQNGATPEAIAQQYEAVALSDIYAVIAYYLRHREELDDYLNQRERLSDRLEQQGRVAQAELHELRERLNRRRRT